VALICSLRFGGRSERAGTSTIIIGSIASAAAMHTYQIWRHNETGLFLVDGILLVAFATIMVLSNRFWPIWITALQIIAVITHLARFLRPTTIPYAYAIAEQLWAWIMLTIITGVCIRRGMQTTATNKLKGCNKPNV
jgi:hypothetical protein